MTEPLEDQLAERRPAPPPTFRGDLRRALLAQRPGRHRPPKLWRMVALAAGAGVVLLGVAVALV